MSHFAKAAGSHLSKAAGSYLSKAAGAALLAFSVVALTAAADPSWRSKPMDQWTPQDAKQVLSSSPWVKWTTVKAYVPRSEDQQREGGKMGGGKGVGLQGLDPRGFLIGSSPKQARVKAIPVNALQVRWESSKAVAAAEAKLPKEFTPDWDGSYYAIAVYGIPISPDDLSDDTQNWDLKKLAVLKRAGKKDLKPLKVEVSPQSSTLSAVVYLFARGSDIGDGDEHIEFDARIGRIMLNQVFDTADMRLGDKLEL